MSDDDDNESSANEVELVDLEWDDALDDWEDELDGSAQAQSAPMPQTSKEAPRPLYRPPSPNDTFAQRPQRPAPQRPPMPPRIDLPAFDDDDEDEAAESTRIAQIPKELIASLVGATERGNERPTRPPPPEKGKPAPVDLDLDGLLDGMDADTRGYDAPVPALPPKPAPRIGGAAEASGARPAPRAPLDEDVVASFPSAPPSSAELDFALDDDEEDVRTRIAPASSSSVRPVSRAPLDELSSPGDELELAEPRVPSTGERASDDDDLDEKAPSAPPHADAARAAPSVPPPLPKLPAVPSPARIPGPPVPPPRAIGVPRPGGLPPIPRPNVPRPGGAPVVPRPQLPSIPKPGEAKRPDRLPIPRPVPRPTPATPAAAKTPSREPDIDALAELDLPVPPKHEPTKSEPPKSAPPEPSPTASDELETAELGAVDATPEDDELDALLDAAEPQPSPTASDELETAELGAIDATPEDDELDALLDAAEPATSADEERDGAVVAAPEHPGADLAPIADASADDGSPIAEARADEATADEPSADEPSAEDDDFVIATEDDELVIATDAGGEDDELVVGAEASEDDDWEDEDWDAIEAAEAEQAAKAELDRGALAARRSVRSRKPRDESFPMVGEGAEALRLRQRLLKSLASSREGAIRARILVGAAELAEQLGDADEARGLFQSALDADPTDVVALRALRRDATARGAWDELAELFAKEAQLDLTSWERALALTGLAELQLTRRGDPAAAERAATRALELEPRSLSARLLLTEARLARGQTAAAMSALAPAAEGWDDPAAQAAVEVELARHAEREGQTERARELYAAAAAHDGGALDALVGLARTACHADPSAAVDALSRIAERVATPLRDAVLTRASRVATLVAHDAARGVALLEGASGVLPLQARAEAAAATGDREVELAALGAWASAAGGTDRALALVRMAEALAAAGDLEGADAALRDASLADGSLGTIRVVREIIARRAGDFSRLVTAVEAGGALAAAARIAADPSALERERELLRAAASEGNALVAVDVLTLDLAAAQGDDAEVDAALRRQADRTPPERRVGSLLALAERAIERGELEPAEALLTEARTLAPGDPLVLRPLGRLALQRDATVTAALFMEEASVASGERAAYAATEAGRVLMRAEGDAVGALRRALDAVPGYGPAAWLLKPLATELGDPLTLGEVHDQLAASAIDPMDAAAHLVRGALLRADADPESAGGLLAKARGHAPDDAVLQSLVMRSMSGTSPADRASMLVSSAAKASPLLARVFRLQAAAAYEDADEPAAAAAQYRELAKTHPEDPVVRFGLDRAEIAAGEIARVAERRFAAVKEADDDRRVLALERLADLDLHERKDPSSAVLSLSSILETAPGHLPSLRALQRYFAEQGRTEDAANVLETLADHIEEGPDVTAHVRLARRLRLAHPDAPGEAADELLVRTAPRAELDLWLAPRVLAAALARDDRATATRAARRLAELLATANERASARLRAAELVEADDALELLRDASQSAPKHPLAALVLAEACERAERFEDAAEAWEQAARASEVRVHAAALFDRAGRLWETKLQNPERARRAYEQASERDVTFGDLFDRLRAILQAAGDRERLAELYTQRLAAGGDTAQLVELYAKQAELYTDLRDLTNAKAALRAALALMPERIDALRALANICLEDEDWRGAAEVLIRIARIRKEREELRWVFFTLGDIYDQHMPDPRRAEAAFQRVLKLFPQDVPAMERLAVLHEREGQHQAAAEMLTELARLDVDPERNRAHRLKLAATYEQLGDARRAEHVLEEARKNAPTDLLVLRAFADFYQRQNAANAMQMHLSRAVNDYRHALEADLGDAAAWPGLVEVLTWRGDGDAASAAASAAQALGIVDIEMSKLVDPRGSAPGLGAGAALDVLDELLAPASLPAQTRAVFRLAGEALEKSLPFDVAAYRAEKINPRDTQIRPIALEVARWFGIPDPQLYVTSAAPRVCVPVYSNPVTVLVGSELLGITDDREKLFVLVRAFKIAHAQLSVVMRAQPHELAALMGGLVTSYDPHHVPASADPALVQEAARRIVKNVARKARDELGPLVFEMAGLPGYDPAVFPMAASEWGNRTALVASGSAPAGLSALAKLSGERDLPSDPSARLGMLTRFPEAASLLAFAISDGHFEARRRGGGRR